MNKEKFFSRLQNILPGQKCSSSKLEPPETSIYFSNISKDALPEFHQYSLNPRLYEFFEFKPFTKMEDTISYYNKMLKRMNEDKSHYYWFVYTKDQDKLIGSACLANINFERSSVEWGQGINPVYWGLNYSLQINEMLKHFIFDVLSMHRLYGQTMIGNERAIECLKASGCIFEGILRDFYKKDNKYIDAWMYSLLSNEYQQINSQKYTSGRRITTKEIISLISEIVPEENINELTNMNNCLNWDSITHTSIIASISQKYKLKLNPTDFAKLTSVKLIQTFLNK